MSSNDGLPEHIWPRGVWVAPYLDKHGHATYVVHDSMGHKIGEFTAHDGRGGLVVREVLEMLLDTVDPIPQDEETDLARRLLAALR